MKTPIKDRAEFQEEGIACYKIFISGLLDITDNLRGEKIIPPKNVVRRDGDDPYLVVAADKGTASFSDIANGISQDYGFWLDDAFASGGSAGYDHKKMGITAKGAWESVKLHFRLLNHDTQEQPFDVVGVGDMGGDVFGNGMLLSKHILLVGAFNHMHIFCDPDPDAAASYKERERLFKAVKGWGDYNTAKLSKGGRIFSRSDKVLKLTPEIQKRFDIEEGKVTPNELMRAILKSRTDLLWFGGIGTYIKSSEETNQDVGDKSNDALRINGKDVRAKVVGEGANLGVTQLGRIEFSQNGGFINTDFIDNSGGVDSSDHEVNIKILMSDVMRKPSHKMGIKARNTLLEKMTDDIANHVLRNNYQQALAISMAELRAQEKLSIQEEFIRDLEREEGLNRDIEYLPNSEEVELRQKSGKGLTRPELCVITSYAKIKLTKELLNTDLPDQDDMQTWVNHYFPSALRNKYEKEINTHRLRREIIAMRMAGSIVNRMGPTFVKYQMKKTDSNYTDVCMAYTIVREIFNLRSLWDQIEALDNKVPASVQLKAMREIIEATSDTVSWFLTCMGDNLRTGEIITRYKSHAENLAKKMDSLITGSLEENTKQKFQSLQRDGLPESLAQNIANMGVMTFVPDIIHIALGQKTDLQETARTYFKIGETFHLDWLRSKAKFMSSDDQREIEAMSGMVDQLNQIQSSLVVYILTDKSLRKKPGKMKIDLWLEKHEKKVIKLHDLFGELQNTGSVDLATMILVERQLRRLYEA